MASEENRERHEEFERRVLALIREQLEVMERKFPGGYEFGDFVITCRFYSAPLPGTSMEPWYGGPYPGWLQEIWTVGSSTSWDVDISLAEQGVDRLLQLQRDEGADAEAASESDDE